MRRKLALILCCAFAATGVTAMPACKKNNTKTDDFDYAALYKTEYTQPFEDISRDTARALYGYTKKSEQGYNGWRYLYGDSPMEYSEASALWQGGGAEIKGDILRPSKDSDAVLEYTARKDGSAVIYLHAAAESEKTPQTRIYIAVNGERLHSFELAAGDTAGRYAEITREIKAGDRICFGVSGDGGRVRMRPTVTYENSQDDRLYRRTAQGKCYGDVFPWYDEEDGKLYMGFLWSDDARLPNAYNNALEISDNFFKYTDVPEANNYAVYRRYYENYRLHYIHDLNKFIDKSLYPAGIRDGFMYRDEENGRYLVVGGGYRQFDSQKQLSDLIIFASDDELGMSWTKPATVVESGYDRNLPECPSLMKIGNRWYVFVSVAYVTAHQVGALQYWTGDAGVDCLDVDWQSKDYAFVDGEDLCAARPTQVGDKVYMWGWIPATYDTMPWSPWGGYLNLPREIVQRKDGSLGGRLDPALKKLLNYGNIYDLSRDGYAGGGTGFNCSDGKLVAQEGGGYAPLGSFNRTFTTFDLKLNGATSAGYALRQGGREYRAVIESENGKKYMKVLSPDDPRHKVNSKIEIDPALDEFEIEIVCDGEFTEFFVNGEYALTAHTAMNDGGYEMYAFADGAAEFRNIKVNKLIPYCEI